MTSPLPDDTDPPTSPPAITHQWADGTRYAGMVVFALGLLGVIAFVAVIRDILLVGFLSAFLLYGPVRWFRRRWPRRPILGIALVYGTAFLALAAVCVWGARWLISQVEAWSATLEQTAATMSSTSPPQDLAAVIAAVQAAGLDQVLTAVMNLRAFSDALSTAVGLVALVGTGLFFAFFLEIHLSTARGALRGVVPDAFGAEVRILLRRLDGLWVGYLQAMVIYCTLLTVGSLVLFVILGVPQPLLMAVFNGLITLIPSIGGLIGSFVTAAVCLTFGSTRFTDMSPVAFATLVLVLHMLLVQITYNFIALPIIGRFVDLPVWAVLLGVLASLAWGNVLLAFLIPPLFGTLRLFGGYVLAKAQRRPPFPTEPEPEASTSGFFSRLFRMPDPLPRADA
jgi:predicted PurR-regulated permease PerM